MIKTLSLIFLSLCTHSAFANASEFHNQIHQAAFESDRTLYCAGGHVNLMPIGGQGLLCFSGQGVPYAIAMIGTEGALLLVAKAAVITFEKPEIEGTYMTGAGTMAYGIGGSYNYLAGENEFNSAHAIGLAFGGGISVGVSVVYIRKL